MPTNHRKNSGPAASPSNKKQVRQRIEDLKKQEADLKARLHRFEAVITAAPSMRQAARLKNWNVLPAPDDLPRRPSGLSRAQAEQVRSARSRQALGSFCLLIVLALFVVWFLYQLKAHNIQW